MRGVARRLLGPHNTTVCLDNTVSVIHLVAMVYMIIIQYSMLSFVINGCDGRLIVKNLITTIQVNFCAAWSWHKIHLNCRY